VEPLYLGICYLFHPLIGIAATAGGLVLVVVALLTELLTRAPSTEVAHLVGSRNSPRPNGNAEVAHAMGMAGRLWSLWSDCNRRYLPPSSGPLISPPDWEGCRRFCASRSIGRRHGAWLVINQQATAGIIASSILTAHWRRRAAIRSGEDCGGAAELAAPQRDFGKMPADQARMAPPKPVHSLAVEAASIVPPGTNRVVVHMAFQLKAGQGLGITGASVGCRAGAGDRRRVDAARARSASMGLPSSSGRRKRWDRISLLAAGHGAVRRGG
jgi:ATP-binding cassette subfamily C protein